MANDIGGIALPRRLSDMAAHCAAMLLAAHGAVALPAPVLPDHSDALTWRNWLFSAPWGRRAHVELFSVGQQFAVLHICILPQLDDPSGIFGFDMLAGRQMATGAFLDVSPVVLMPPPPSLNDLLPPSLRPGCGTPRARPDWGNIFSDQFLAVRPDTADACETVLIAARVALQCYLARAPATQPNLRGQIAAGQQAYIDGQRRNPHTERMLARHVGPAAARDFIDQVLFAPLPPAQAEFDDAA